jgi:predicted CopG family antitoxin
MKTLNVTLETEEYNALIEKKGKKTWREFILDLANVKIKGQT